MQMPAELQAQPRYAGFWTRVKATLLDFLWQVPLGAGLGYIILGRAYFNPNTGWYYEAVDALTGVIVPTAAILAFWFYRQATPGKLLCGIKIVDAITLGRPEPWQWLLRAIGYIPATLPWGLGLLWVAFDKRHQGWHDKLARTVVIYADDDI